MDGADAFDNNACSLYDRMRQQAEAASKNEPAKEEAAVENTEVAEEASGYRQPMVPSSLMMRPLRWTYGIAAMRRKAPQLLTINGWINVNQGNGKGGN